MVVFACAVAFARGRGVTNMQKVKKLQAIGGLRHKKRKGNYISWRGAYLKACEKVEGVTSALSAPKAPTSMHTEDKLD